MGLYEIWAKCQRHLWAGIVSFFSTDFSSIFLVHSFERFFIEFCVCDIVSCFVLGRWVDGAEFRCKRKSQRHLWAGIESLLSTDFSSFLLVHSYLRFFIEFCVCDIVSCFVLSK